MNKTSVEVDEAEEALEAFDTTGVVQVSKVSTFIGSMLTPCAPIQNPRNSMSS